MSYYVSVSQLVGGAVFGRESVNLPLSDEPVNLVVPAVDADVEVYLRGTTTRVDVYGNDTGAGSPVTQTLTTDTDGDVVISAGVLAFVEQPALLDVVVSGGNVSGTRTFNVGVDDGGAVTRDAIIGSGVSAADLGGLQLSGSIATGDIPVGSAVPNAPPSSSIVDTLASVGAMSGSWTTAGWGFGALAIESAGEATSSAAGTICASVYTAAEPADQEIRSTAAVMAAGGEYLVQLLRSQTSGDNGYRIKWTTTGVSVYNNATSAFLGGNGASLTVATGDGLLSRVYGSTIECWHQPGGSGAWTLVASITDTAWTTGATGLGTSSQNVAWGPVGVAAVAKTTTVVPEDPHTGSDLQIFVKDGDLYVDPLKNGVVAGGSVDQSLAMKAVFQSAIAQNKPMKIPAVEIVLDTAEYIVGTPMVEADGAIFLCGHTNDAIWNFSGDAIESQISAAAGQHSYTALANLTANAAINTDSATDQVINAPTTGSGWALAQGDVVMLGDLTTLVGGSSATLTSAALNMYEVKTVISGSQFTITEPLIYPLTTANGAYMLVNKALQAGGASGGFWHGGTFIGTQAYTGTETASALRLWSLRDFEFYVKAQELTDFAFLAQDCWSLSGAVDVADLADVGGGGHTGQFGYGFAWGGATAHGKMRIDAKRVRHASAFVGTGHDCWADVIAVGTTSTAADAHAGFTDSGYPTVEADGCPVGIALRGLGYRAGAVNAKNCQTGAYIFDAPGDVKIDVLNVENTIPADGTADPTGATGHCVRVDQNCGRLIIGGGRWQDIRGHGVYLNLSETAADLELVGVSMQNLLGNTQSSNKGYGVYMTSSSGINRGRLDGVVMGDNQGSPTTTAMIYAGSSSITDLQVKNHLLTDGVQVAAGPSAGLVVDNDISAFVPVTTVLTGSGNYTIPAGATKLSVTVKGGAGGGGSGPVLAPGVLAYGGGGGSDGSLAKADFPVSELTSPIAYICGAAGANGAAVTTPSTNGNPGTGGGNSHLGGLLWAYGGAGGGAGGTAAPAAAAAATGMYPTNTGAAGMTSPPAGNNANSAVGGGAAGAGGGITAGNVAGPGGNASQSSTFQGGTAGTGGAAGGTAGNNGAASTVPWNPGCAGGGGGGSVTGNGGNGGNGNGNGAAGGGGGAAQNGNQSGAGGVPTAGSIVVIAS